ncbi:hypothetical protein [Mycobacterium sp. SMC-4]|uniref:hypothetical protein n=1 Tax=Mycobacterium sp. SMC-4 TaxID=2857059 RepID=UPI0021B2AB29|nr:hypothetical protein [Mycobacterium sp. SMC-4]UXA17584.1 hypothetical protein KXD98_23165 [Mycobacterium sp. SMC-4]
MNAFVNVGGVAPSPPGASPHVGLLKGVVREELGLDDDVTVIVQQLACVEPDCPPVETVIAVLGNPRRSWKFACASTDVTVAQLREVLAAHPKGREHDDHD